MACLPACLAFPLIVSCLSRRRSDSPAFRLICVSFSFLLLPPLAGWLCCCLSVCGNAVQMHLLGAWGMGGQGACLFHLQYIGTIIIIISESKQFNIDISCYFRVGRDGDDTTRQNAVGVLALGVGGGDPSLALCLLSLFTSRSRP